MVSIIVLYPEQNVDYEPKKSAVVTRDDKFQTEALDRTIECGR